MIKKMSVRNLIVLCIMVLISSFSTFTDGFDSTITEQIGLTKEEIQQYTKFIDLDHDNKLNPEYSNFKWASWKLAISFVNPALSMDSFSYNTRVFQDLNPQKSYWEFLTDEIVRVWMKHTVFYDVQWVHNVPVKQTAKVLTFKHGEYTVLLPGSPNEIFKETGCRFILLLQRFSPRIFVGGDKSTTLLYQNISSGSSRFQSYLNTRMIYTYSFTYVLYDLMEDDVVQVGSIYEENKKETTTAKDLKKELDEVLNEIIEISQFHNKRN